MGGPAGTSSRIGTGQPSQNSRVTATPNKFKGLPLGARAVQIADGNTTNYFLTVFGRPEGSSACECERTQESSLAQSLHFINAPDIQKKLTDDKGRAAVLAQDDKRSDEAKLTEIYQWVASRQPTPQQVKLGLAHIEKRTAGKTDKELVAAKRQAYEDLLWALINTKEFLFNH